ncbi:Cys-Gln thioester bond-forming surface protein [Erysipelothrix sp. HDW6C]|uniref:MSCRAMM family protein n=1 Tax=Erysipelothrix sp. HDW6C TaxID=2714930 RepID=UPI00140D8C4D|nr:SpaA isopeptide-forming pilin-related protein [Erysipelothrix sp. HDW6C]QIK70649.1 Cys-Gln thioester bond-forming surface protein [Erysipelothrix sp. HDW6C]
MIPAVHANDDEVYVSENETVDFEVTYYLDGDTTTLRQFKFGVEVSELDTDSTRKLEFTDEGHRIIARYEMLPDREVLSSFSENYQIIAMLDGSVIVIEPASRSKQIDHGNAVVQVGEVLSYNTSFYWRDNPSFYWVDIDITEVTINGQVGYCLEPSILNVSTSNGFPVSLKKLQELRVMESRLKYQISESQKTHIQRIANYGYTFEGHQTPDYRWATQILILEALGWNFHTYGTRNPQREIREINRLIAAHDDRPVWDRTQQTVSVGEVIDLSDRTLTDYSIRSQEGLEVIEHSQSTLRVKVVENNAQLSMVKKHSELGESYVYSNGNTQQAGILKLDEAVNVAVRFNFKKGSIAITKTNDRGSVLEGVHYVFSDSPTFETIVAKGTTDTMGMLRIENLEHGQRIYYKEVKEAPGHQLDDTVYYVDIIADTTIYRSHMNPVITGKLRVIKHGENEELLTGVAFEIMNRSEECVAIVTTGADGTAISNDLDYGEYYLKEYETAEGYQILEDKIPFSITQPEETVSLFIKNDRIRGSIEIFKVSEADEVPLVATFRLYDADMRPMGDYTTDSDSGKVIIENLPYGQYFIEEIAVESPYILGSNPIQIVEISEHLKTYPLVFKNEKVQGEIHVYKKDAKNNTPISGVTFALYEVNVTTQTLPYESLIKQLAFVEVKTDQYGFTAFPNLDVEKSYLLVEKETIYGYMLDKTIHTIHVPYSDPKTPNVVIEKNLLNNRRSVQIIATKIDGVSEDIIDLPHQLELYDQSGNLIAGKLQHGGITTWTVDALEVYTLKEIQPPEGYRPLDEDITVDTRVDKGTGVYHIQVRNDSRDLPSTGLSINNQRIAAIVAAIGVILCIYVRKRTLR